MSLSVFLADDHAVVRNGLKPWLETQWHRYLHGAGAQVKT